MKLYDVLKESLEYELTHYAEDYGFTDCPPVDIEKTSRRIYRWMARTNRVAWYRTRQDWEIAESGHLTVMDWLSMYEPTFTEELASV